jgi:hypothetical protein
MMNFISSIFMTLEGLAIKNIGEFKMLYIASC